MTLLASSPPSTLRLPTRRQSVQDREERCAHRPAGPRPGMPQGSPGTAL